MENKLRLLILLFLVTTASAGTIELIESVPMETIYDTHLRNADVVWLEMLNSAEEQICIESFYFCDNPDSLDSLDYCVTALKKASEKGVKIRTVCDSKFYNTYPDLPDYIGQLPGAYSYVLDVSSLWGGVQHSKFMVIDDNQFFVGSQNWDWRALDHIRELGVLVKHPELVNAIEEIFIYDSSASQQLKFRQDECNSGPFELLHNDQVVSVKVAASPPRNLPPGISHDLPILIDMIDNAKSTIKIQLLSYNPSNYDKSSWTDLDSALRNASKRGVNIEMILSNWSKVHYKLKHIKALAESDNIDIKFTNIPQWSGGFISYARVEHAKYMTVDGADNWVGTSNWSEGYFTNSRNVSVFVTGKSFAQELETFFNLGWNGPYAEVVEQNKSYQPPRKK
jgi:phosphatidylserine/phosphatidylglycerophosphate/cardiolipin synthase-like enzyme